MLEEQVSERLAEKPVMVIFGRDHGGHWLLWQRHYYI